MELIPIHVNYDHRNLVNNPPFITNNPVHEKLAEHKLDFKKNELALFHDEWVKDKIDNGFLTAFILAAFGGILTGGIYLYKRTKSAIKKLK